MINDKKLKLGTKCALHSIVTLAISLLITGYSYADDNHDIKSTDKSDKTLKIKEVKKFVPPEKSFSSVNKKIVKRSSPSQNFLTILKNIPGMNVITQGPGNLSSTAKEFTYQGFNSTEMASNFDGVPIINIFRGGTGGEGDDRAISPLTVGQISSVKVYSGASQPSQSGIDSLGGTISYEPAMPTSKFYVDLDSSGGKYSYRGGSLTTGLSVNSGIIPSTGTKILLKYFYTKSFNFSNNVNSKINSYYASIVQPYNHGLSRISLVAVYNAEQALMPSLVPLPLLALNRAYQVPLNVSNQPMDTHALNLILSWKSLLNRFMVAKTKFFIEEHAGNRISYTNAAYNDINDPGYALYQGYPLPILLQPYAAPPSTNDSYNPVDLFGSAINGTQYHDYYDDINSIGIMPSISFFLPHNVVELGGMVERAKDHNGENWYGNSSVPIILGYNDAWEETDTRDFNYVYLQDNIGFLENKLHIYPGIKYNIVTSATSTMPGYYGEYPGFISKSYYFFEPSLGFSYSPNRNLNIFLNVGRTTKVPNISALYSVLGFAPTPGPIIVNPESDISYDAGVRFNYSHITGSFTLYRRDFSNIFSNYYNQRLGQAFAYNNGTAVYQGITFDLNVPIIDHLSLFGNYNYTSAKYTSRSVSTNGITTPGEYRPYVPMYTALAGINYQNNGLYASLSGHFVGRQYLGTVTGETIGTTLPSYDTLDLKVSYKKNINSTFLKSIDLSLYADNLLNNNYIVYAQKVLAPFSYLQGQAGAPVFVGSDVKLKFS